MLVIQLALLMRAFFEFGFAGLKLALALPRIRWNLALLLGGYLILDIE